MLIVFESIDGGGKSTQIKLLKEYLDSNNIDNIVVRDPGSTELSEKIRNILLTDNIDKVTEALLFLSSRNQLLHEIIIPARRAGKVVLCDRFHMSTYAYQGWGLGLMDKIFNLIDCLYYRPSITFYLEINYNTMLERIKNPDKIESRGMNYYNRVLKGYNTYIEKYIGENIERIDGTLKKEDIQDIIKLKLYELCKEGYAYNETVNELFNVLSCDKWIGE